MGKLDAIHAYTNRWSSGQRNTQKIKELSRIASLRWTIFMGTRHDVFEREAVPDTTWPLKALKTTVHLLRLINCAEEIVDMRAKKAR